MSDAPRATGSDRADMPVGELVADMTAQVTALLREEVELAKVELKGEAKRAAKAGGMLSGGAVSGYFALLFGSLALAWLLDRRLPRPVAFALVSLLHGAGAAGLLALGRQEIKQLDPVPTQTIETLKDNVEFARASLA